MTNTFDFPSDCTANYHVAKVANANKGVVEYLAVPRPQYGAAICRIQSGDGFIEADFINAEVVALDNLADNMEGQVREIRRRARALREDKRSLRTAAK